MSVYDRVTEGKETYTYVRRTRKRGDGKLMRIQTTWMRSGVSRGRFWSSIAYNFSDNLKSMLSLLYGKLYSTVSLRSHVTFYLLHFFKSPVINEVPVFSFFHSFSSVLFFSCC